mmetsp:Transcript_34904/g.105217  ORF Transcript_34904/g.105217 Transcript_34904/m.105217 type:complete len:232 (+) Transcript_34904:122-817(+)
MQAFGRPLQDMPIMRNVLADMLVECEAATTLAFRIAESFDEADDAEQQAFGRIGTAIAKYHICKRAPQLAYEAMECLGGNAYVEEGPMPRLFRQSPLNAIWEGSGNIICVDVLRAVRTTEGALDAVMHEIHLAAGMNANFDIFVKEMPELSEANARRFVGSLAVALQASLLLRRSDPSVAEAFCATRLVGGLPRADYGTLPDIADVDGILKRGTGGADIDWAAAATMATKL